MAKRQTLFRTVTKATGRRIGDTAVGAMAIGAGAASIVSDKVADALDSLRDDPRLYGIVAAHLGAAFRCSLDD